MKKSIKILLISLSATIVLVGGGVGIYFGVKGKSDEAPQQIGLKLTDLESSFATYQDNELTDFMNYLKEAYNLDVPYTATEAKNDKVKKVFDFYKKHSDLESKAMDEIHKFKSIYRERTTYLDKDVNQDLLRSKLNDKFPSLADLRDFVTKEEIRPGDGDDFTTREGVIKKILEVFRNTLIEKTRKYQLWKNFEEENKLLGYAKEVRDDLNDIDDIKGLTIEELYQLNYDCWMKHFQDRIDADDTFQRLYSMENQKLIDFLSWIRDNDKNAAFPITGVKDTDIPYVITYYKNANMTLREFSQKLDDFNRFYTDRESFLAKELPVSLKTQLEEKFNSVAEITSFKDEEGVTTLPSDSLDSIINKIIIKWNSDLHSRTSSFTLWKNFEEENHLFDYAKQQNTQISTLDDLKTLSPSELFQLHYDAWSDYYSQKIISYSS